MLRDGCMAAGSWCGVWKQLVFVAHRRLLGGQGGYVRSISRKFDAAGSVSYPRVMDPTHQPDPVADSRGQLRGAGWSLGIAPLTARDGDSAWLVTARKAGHWVVARGATSAIAWGDAAEQARLLDEVLGSIGVIPSPEDLMPIGITSEVGRPVVGKEDVEGRFVLRDVRFVELAEDAG
jgi:hypothetical protein